MGEGFELKIREIEKCRDENISKLEQEISQQKTAYETDLKQLNDKINHEELKKKLLIEQIEDEQESEICSLKNEFESKINLEHENSLKLRGENGIMKKKFITMKTEIDDLKEVLAKKGVEASKLQQNIRNLEKDISLLKKHIEEKEQTIEEKNKKISQLNKKNLELEKYKFVLGHKIDELNKTVAPVQEEAQKSKEDLAKMESELMKNDDKRKGL